jgi:hypothetical protein
VSLGGRGLTIADLRPAASRQLWNCTRVAMERQLLDRSCCGPVSSCGETVGAQVPFDRLALPIHCVLLSCRNSAGLSAAFFGLSSQALSHGRQTHWSPLGKAFFETLHCWTRDGSRQHSQLLRLLGFILLLFPCH